MRPDEPTNPQEHPSDPDSTPGKPTSRPRPRRSSRRLRAGNAPPEVAGRKPTLKLGIAKPLPPAPDVVVTVEEPAQGRGLLEALEATERRRAELARTVGELQDDVERGRERERRASEAIATLESERTEREQTFEEQHVQLGDLQQALQVALGQLESAALDRERLEEELASVRTEDAKARRALLDEEERRMAIVNLSRDKAVEKSEKDRRRALAERDGAIREKAALERALGADAARYGSEIAALERRLDLLGAQLRGVTEERDEARAARDRSSRDCAAALAEYEVASAELRDSDIAHEEAMAELDRLNDELAGARRERATHERIHDQLVLDARAARTQAQELEQALSVVREELTVAVEAGRQGAELTERLQQSLSTLQAEVDELGVDKELADERLSAADAELAEATERAFGFMKERDEARARLLELTATLEAERERRSSSRAPERRSSSRAPERRPDRASAKPTVHPGGGSASSTPPLVSASEGFGVVASSPPDPVLVENLPFEIAGGAAEIPRAPKPPTFGNAAASPRAGRRDGRYSMAGGQDEEVTRVRLPRRK